jgi:hypothetical protein
MGKLASGPLKIASDPPIIPATIDKRIAISLRGCRV